MIPRLSVAAILASVAFPLAAAADQFDFARVNQQGRIGDGDFDAAWSVEVSKEIGDAARPGAAPGSGGGGGTGEGKKGYDGVMHRVSAYYGPTSYFDFGAEQSFRQIDYGEFQYAVLMPRLTLKINPLAPEMFANWPVIVSTFLSSQARINARRDSSLVMGFGVDKITGRFAFTVNAGFETTMAAVRREDGMRYQGGACYRVWSPLTLGVETWGTLVWPEDGRFVQTHHAGPTVKLRLERAWFSVNAAYGMKEQPNKYFTDQTYLFQVGLGL